MRIIEISINANLFPVKYLKSSVITIFNFEVCSPPPPLDPASHLHMLCQYTISVYSSKDLLGPGGGGEHTLILKMVMTLFLYFLTGNKFALKHVSLMYMCNRTKTKAGLFQQYILCLVL